MSVAAAKSLQRRFQRYAKENLKTTDQYREVLGRYTKHQIPLLGIKTPELRKIIKQWKKEDVGDAGLEQLKDISYEMAKRDTLEEKISSLYVIRMFAERHLSKKDLPYFSKLFDEGLLYGWWLTDAASSIVGIAVRGDKEGTEEVCKWNQSDNIWKVRASAVSFVVPGQHGDAKMFDGFFDLMIDTVTETIKSDERFIQLGCGWLLRQLSVSDRSRIIAFIEDHYDDFSREGLRYAIEKLDKPEKKRLLDFGKDRTQSKKRAAPPVAASRRRASKRRKTVEE